MLTAPEMRVAGGAAKVTPTGDSLLQLSHRIFKDLQETVTGISDTRETLDGTMRLVGGMTVCLYVFPTLLAEVRRAFPSLDLKITVGGMDRSIAMLRSGAADLGLGTLPVGSTDLASEPVLEEELLLITYPTHPLAKKRKILPADLHRQPFILFEAGSVTRRLIDEFCVRERVEPDIVMETENVEIIKTMVHFGLGISIVPWQAAAADVRSKALFCSRIAGHAFSREVGWLYPKMSRLPRPVSEVIRVFERLRPRFEEEVRAPRNF